MSKAFGGWDENVLEIATLCLGALVAVAYSINPCIVAFALPPLLVLHRAVLVHYLKEAADLDGKTGLLNAAAWHTQAERALSRKNRGAGPRGVLVLDLDHFKAVNDTHGHLAGDEVLAAVADTLRSEVRDRDLVARFGGEEFVVILENASRDDALSVAEDVRTAFVKQRVETMNGEPIRTTVSAGCATLEAWEVEGSHLLERADVALAMAKQAGRNQVVAA
jgi:diguanylate cyclase (GGDEF)-like protein